MNPSAYLRFNCQTWRGRTKLMILFTLIEVMGAEILKVIVYGGF